MASGQPLCEKRRKTKNRMILENTISVSVSTEHDRSLFKEAEATVPSNIVNHHFRF